MENLDKLPFKVGQMAEAKSFLKGYRGAWFRCKILEIDGRKGYTRYSLEYIDFPDEKITLTKIYQVSLWNRKNKAQGSRQLMVRPQYPCRYNEIKMLPSGDGPTECPISVDDVWKVGDLVDWWFNGCYWTGTMTRLLGNDRAEIALLEPPEGEGEVCEASFDDLRPALDWSPEHGWRDLTSKNTAFTHLYRFYPPILNNLESQEGENCRSRVRLVQQLKQGEKNNSNKAAVGLLNLLNEESKDVEDGSPVNASKDVEDGSPVNASLSSHNSANSLPASSDKSKRRKTRDVSVKPSSITAVTKEVTLPPGSNQFDARENSSIQKPSLADSVSSSHFKDASTETAVDTASEDLDSNPAGLETGGGSIPLNIMFSDSLHAVILDLEELVNRVQWLKDILDHGITLSNDVRPPWKFLDHRASSTPK